MNGTAATPEEAYISSIPKIRKLTKAAALDYSHLITVHKSILDIVDGKRTCGLHSEREARHEAKEWIRAPLFENSIVAIYARQPRRLFMWGWREFKLIHVERRAD